MEISLSGGGYSKIAEYANIQAPNGAGQSISSNTVTTVTLNTEVEDVDGIGSLGSNQVTLSSGTYAFKALVSPQASVGVGDIDFFLWNATDSVVLKGRNFQANGSPVPNSGNIEFSSEFTISGTKAIELRIISATAVTLGRNDSGTYQITVSTAGLSQRATLQLWKKL